MRFVEETGGLWTAEQLRAAEAEIEQQKREWEANRLAALEKEREAERQRQEEDELLTYSRADAKNQVNTKSKFQKPPPTTNKSVIRAATVANRKRGALADHCDTITATPTQPRALHKQGRTSTTHVVRVARRRATSRSTVSNHSGSERRRRKNLAVRSPSVAPAVPPPPVKRTKIMTEDTSQVTHAKRTPHVERNSKARAALLTKNRREAAAKRRMLLHKKAVVTSATSRTKDEAQNDVTNGDNSSNELKPSDEEDSSECSLDAMYDSIDDDGQSEETPSKQASSSSSSSSDEDNDSEEEYRSPRRPNRTAKGLRNGKSQSTKAAEASSSSESDASEPSDNNHLDINSPRSTRSRGTVKLNLWTLDVSPIMPVKTPKRRSKPNNNHSASDDQPDGTPTVKKASLGGIVTTTTEAEEDSCASVSSVKQAAIRDGFDVKRPDKATPPPRKKPIPKVVATTPTSNARHNTLDNWISKSPRTLRALSPMVILNKDDVPRHMHPSPLATTVTAVRSTAAANGGDADNPPDSSKLRRTRTKSVYRSVPAENGQTT